MSVSLARNNPKGGMGGYPAQPQPGFAAGGAPPAGMPQQGQYGSQQMPPQGQYGQPQQMGAPMQPGMPQQSMPGQMPQQGQYGSQQPMQSGMPGQMPQQQGQYGSQQPMGMPQQQGQYGSQQPMQSGMPGQMPMGGAPMQSGMPGQMPGQQYGQVGMNPPLNRVSLVKGQNMSLTKAAPGLKHARIGLGWDVRQTPGAPFDLDASCFMLNAQNQVVSPQHFVFYNNRQSPDGSIVQHGDNLTGMGEGDDEQVSVDLLRVPPEIQRIVFVCSIYEAEQTRPRQPSPAPPPSSRAAPPASAPWPPPPSPRSRGAGAGAGASGDPDPSSRPRQPSPAPPQSSRAAPPASAPWPPPPSPRLSGASRSSRTPHVYRLLHPDRAAAHIVEVVRAYAGDPSTEWSLRVCLQN